MKKIYVFAIFLLVLSMLLASCAPAATEAPAVEEPAAEQPAAEEPAEEMEPVTLRVLTWQNPPTVEFVEAFNEKFEAAHPNITVDYSVVNANDIQTVTQTRLTANDIDVIAMFGFANAAQPYMSEVEPQAWQQLVQAGLLMDLTGQPFIDNYDEASIRDAGTVDGKVYQINLGRVSYSGVYYNKDIFAEYGVEVPTTWDELVAACETFKENGVECMTNGGADGWPIFVGAYGLLGALYPDQAALVEGLWTGDIKWDDADTLELWEKYRVYAQEMLEPGTSGIAGDAAPGRFASGAVAMFPNGVWYAGAIEDAERDFAWGYISEFSEPENYQEFANAVGFIPTQPTATLDTQIGQDVAPYLENFLVGYEQFFTAPKGAGQWANGGQGAAWFQPFGEWDDPVALAQQSQADLQAGLDTLE